MDSRTKSLRKRARRIADALDREYGSPRHGNPDDPLDDLVFILLSQMTTAPSYARVYERLRARVTRWEQVLAIPRAQLQRLIRDAGLSRQKAASIHGIVRRLVADFGQASLAPIRDWDDARVERYLTSLPGVGVKSARCVMMYALQRAVLPVDTHLWRLARRVGLVASRIPYDHVHDALHDVVPPRARYALHVNAIAHGRAVCRAKAPRCAACSISSLCSYRRRGGAAERSRTTARV